MDGAVDVVPTSAADLEHAKFAVPAVATTPLSQSSKPSARRARYAPVSCTACKSAHKACSGGRPCARCIRLGISDACIDVTHQRRGRPRKAKDCRTSSKTNVALANDFASLGEDQQLVPFGPQSPQSASPEYNPLGLEHLLNATGWETLVSEIITSTLAANKPFQGPYAGVSPFVAGPGDIVNSKYDFTYDFELGLVPENDEWPSAEKLAAAAGTGASTPSDGFSFTTGSPASSLSAGDSGVDSDPLNLSSKDPSCDHETFILEQLAARGGLPVADDLEIHFDLLDLTSPTAGKVAVTMSEIGSRDLMIFTKTDEPLVPGGTWALLANVDWRRSKNPLVLETLQSAVACKALKSTLLNEQDPVARAAIYNLMTTQLEQTQKQWERLRTAAFRKVCIVDYVQWPLDNMPMCAWGMDAILFKVNPMLCELLGLSPEEIMTKIKFAFNLLAPEDVSAAMILHVGAVLSGLDSYESSYSMIQKSGVRVRRRVRTTVARNPSGQYLYSYATSVSHDDV